MDPMVCLTVVLFFTTVSSSTLSSTAETKYKFLCWLPVPVKSHQRLFEPFLREMANRGHHITFVTPMPIDDPPPNIEHVVIHNQFENLKEMIKNQGFLDRLLPWRLMASILKYVESFYKDPVVIEFLSSERQFDGIIMEVLMHDAFIGLHHKYNAPIIDIQPLPHFHWSYHLLGIPYDPSYIVDTMVPYTDHMSFIERLHNTVISAVFRFAGENFLLPYMQEVMDKYLRYPGWETRPTVKEMVQNVSLVLINTHFAFSYPYPLPPHAKEIAGVNMLPPKPLSKDLQEFIDSSKEGVILFSFGSHIDMSDTLGPERMDVFRRFFSGIKQKVLWKLDSEVPDLPPNVKITKWFPQNDILGHPNVRLFMSHCGYHSSVESMYNGVPVVAIPVQGDQTKNAKMLTHYGLALTLNLDNITDQTVEWSVNEVLTNHKYKANALTRSRICRDRKEWPLETAVYWTEYVLRHEGAPHLKPAVLSLQWYQHALLDVYATLILILVTPVILFYYLVKSIISRLRIKQHNSSSKMKTN